MRLLSVVVFLMAFALPAQQQPVFHADATLVTVPVLVTDFRGNPVHDLKPEEFRLYDNGVPREVRHIWLEEELPLVIGILVDISASQHSFLREHQATVDAFLAQLLRPGDRAFVVTVNEKVVLQSEFVGQPTGISQVPLARGGEPLGAPCPTLKGRQICGGTTLWDAVYETARMELSRFSGSGALLILSDGNDTGSIHHLDEALEEVHRIGALAYAIRYPDPLSDLAGDGLSRLAAETGGAEFAAPAGGYAAIFGRIQRDLRSQYVLGFHPEGGGNSKHLLRVDILRPGVLVRSRRQYFLAPE
jgi:VWFA-related protein